MPNVTYPNLTIRTPTAIDPALLTALRPLDAGTRKVDGVLEGGGALGLAYCGTLRLLQDQGIWFARVAGNSAGAITASMIAAGFDATEMQWLMSSNNSGPKPQSLVKLETAQKFSPIAFIKFLDLPTIDTISKNSKRNTLLWKALDLSLADWISGIPVPVVPTRSKAVKDLERAILAIPVIGPAVSAGSTAAKNAGTPDPLALLDNALTTAFSFLPDAPATVGDLIPLLKGLDAATKGFRDQLADKLWDAIVKKNPLIAVAANLEQEGSIFEGDFALTTIRQLLELKVGKSPVKFTDLKIPLTVIGSNLTTQKMEVYSCTMTPNMEVAEAVRRSMSVPLVFQPLQEPAGEPIQLKTIPSPFSALPIAQSRIATITSATGPQLPGGRAAGMIVDGGLCSNFPVWAFAPGSAGYWPATSVDNTRPVIGLSLDETLPEKPNWDVDKPRFPVPVGQTTVPDPDVIIPLLATVFHDWVQAQPDEFDLTPDQVAQSIDRILDGLNGTGTLQVELAGSLHMNSENSTRAAIVSALMQGRAFFDVTIPLRGYHWLDFQLNEDMGALRAMWDRSWHAALDALSTAPQTMSAGEALVKESGLTSPFKP